MFFNYLAYEDDSAPDNAPFDEELLLQALLVDPWRIKLEMLESAYFWRHPFFYDPGWSLGIQKIRYESPLEIEASTESESRWPVSFSRLRSIARLVLRILTIDLMRERARWDSELTRQKAIEAALKNAERALNLSKKIKDPALRDEFIRNMARSLTPLSHPDAPRLKDIEVLDPPPKKK